MAYLKTEQVKKTKKKKKKAKIGLPALKAKVQRVVNKYCRDRDINNGCISCGKHTKLQGGHYIPQGSCSFLRFNTDNIHGQCMPCNHFKSGNLMLYRIALVNKLGEDRVKWLEEHRNDVKKWTREELEELLTKYKSLE